MRQNLDLKGLTHGQGSRLMLRDTTLCISLFCKKRIVGPSLSNGFLSTVYFWLRKSNSIMFRSGHDTLQSKGGRNFMCDLQKQKKLKVLCSARVSANSFTDTGFKMPTFLSERERKTARKEKILTDTNEQFTLSPQNLC